MYLFSFIVSPIELQKIFRNQYQKYASIKFFFLKFKNISLVKLKDIDKFQKLMCQNAVYLLAKATGTEVLQ